MPHFSDVHIELEAYLTELRVLIQEAIKNRDYSLEEDLLNQIDYIEEQISMEVTHGRN